MLVIFNWFCSIDLMALRNEKIETTKLVEKLILVMSILLLKSEWH